MMTETRLDVMSPAGRIAEAAKARLDHATDPEIAAQDDPSGAPGWSRALDDLAADTAMMRADVDRCFEDIHGLTPADYAAEREAFWLDAVDAANPKRYAEICAVYFRDHAPEQDADQGNDAAL